MANRSRLGIWCVDDRQARLVGEQLSHGDMFLALLGELRPVGGDRLVEVEEVARVGGRHGGRGHALGRGEDRHDRVGPPRQAALAIPQSTPQVHDLLAISEHRHGRTDLFAVTEILSKGVRDGTEPIGDVTADL